MTCDECGGEMSVTREDYPYEESGLSNVVLKDIEVRRCPNGHTEAIIPRVAELHATLARMIAKKPVRLSGAEFRFLRKHMGYSGAEFAKVLGKSPEHLSRWENEKLGVSQTADIAIRGMVLMGRRAEEYQAPVEELEPHPIVLSLDGSWQQAGAAA